MHRFFKIYKRKKYLTFLLFALLPAVFLLEGETLEDPRRVITTFIQQINNNAYPDAYSAFSNGLKEEVTFDKFKDAFRKVKKLHLLSCRVVEQRKKLVRLKLKITAKELEEGKLLKRQYNGTIVMIPERNKWKLIQIILEETDHKQNKEQPGKRLL